MSLRHGREPCAPTPSGAKRRPSWAIRTLLADNVTRLRQARGLTQLELARACGLAPSYIGDVEQATVNITLANLEAVALGLHCSLVDLFSPHPTPAAPDTTLFGVR